jgi:hypothetical protein
MKESEKKPASTCARSSAHELTLAADLEWRSRTGVRLEVGSA